MKYGKGIAGLPRFGIRMYSDTAELATQPPPEFKVSIEGGGGFFPNHGTLSGPGDGDGELLFWYCTGYSILYLHALQYNRGRVGIVYCTYTPSIILQPCLSTHRP